MSVDVSGTFKILRGTNECGIEGTVMAAAPQGLTVCLFTTDTKPCFGSTFACLMATVATKTKLCVCHSTE